MILLIVISGCGDSPDATTDDVPPADTASVDESSAERRYPTAPLPVRTDGELTQRPLRPDDWFEDVTARSRIDFTSRNGLEAQQYSLLETIGSGAAILDYDRDGDMDVLITGGGGFQGQPVQVAGQSSGLFRNDGDWQFTEVTVEAGLTDASLYTHGCSVGDFDTDGFPDVFVAGFGGARLFHNQQDGTFLDVAATAGLICDGWNVSGAWLDINRDGHLDLYVLTYADWTPESNRICLNHRNYRDVCGPTDYEGIPDMLWLSQGDGTFADVSAEAGLEEGNRGLGVVIADFNADDWPDIVVVNDVEENQLYLGQPQWPLDSVGVLAGIALSPDGRRQGSMGVDLGDYDRDGQPDLFYTNFSLEDNSLLRKVDAAGFVNAEDVAGLSGVSRKWVGFGTAFADFNADGWLDLIVSNGHVRYYGQDGPYFQPAQLFRNDQGRRFQDISQQAGPYFDVPRAGRGLAIGDLDNDSLPDLVVVHQNEPVACLRNTHTADGSVTLTLVGTSSNRDAIGARVAVVSDPQTAGEPPMTFWQRGGGGYLTSFDPRVFVPPTGTSSFTVTVKWPDGGIERFSGLQADGQLTLIEGTGDAI